MYPRSFESAADHAMLYEVGSFWDVSAPGAYEGLINNAAHRRACGYVNDPDDRGGETKYGVASNANTDLDIASLDWEGAKRVYYRRYWLASNCDDITLFAPRLAVLHFDGAVNHGVGRAGRFLQRAVGVAEDGDVGPATLAATERMVIEIGEIALCERICDYRQDFYESIIQRNPSQAKYRRGWMRRIQEMRAFVTDANAVF